MGKTDPEVITLSALRALVITTIYGRGGFSRSAETVHEDELPAGADAQQVEACVLPLLADLISGRSAHFLARSALTALAVLAGLGIAVHHTTPWAEPSNALGSDSAVASRTPGGASPTRSSTRPRRRGAGSAVSSRSSRPRARIAGRRGPAALHFLWHHQDLEHTHEPRICPTGNQHPGQPGTPWGAPAQGTPPVPPAPRRPSRGKAWVTHGAVALFLGVGIGISDDEALAEASDAGPVPKITVTKEVEVPGPAVTVTKTATVTAKPPKPKGPRTTVGGDGEYVVGEEMRAGTYRTAGPGDSFGCYGERARNSSGEFDAIIASGNLEGSGRVTVNNGEILKSTGCQDWKKAG
ncbi:hypothetical protein [Streptomyces cyaneofuscatus]|uniref:hypothetical protein n=1 Tax=Streptomyces cyaneofuscatus TaxID=66883 RepID=UPI00365F842D